MSSRIHRRPDGQLWNIIICEDKKQEAFKMRQIMESKGYNVLESMENGRQLINYMEENPNKVDMVLLDIVMPVLDGFATFVEMREKGLGTRVVFATVENSRAVMAAAAKLGAVGYIATSMTRDSSPLFFSFVARFFLEAVFLVSPLVSLIGVAPSGISF